MKGWSEYKIGPFNTFAIKDILDKFNAPFSNIFKPLSTLFYLGSSIALGVTISYVINNNNSVRRLDNKLERLSTNSVPTLTIQDTLGTQEPEKFYQFATNRAYLEIDGKTVESYFSKGAKWQIKKTK